MKPSDSHMTISSQDVRPLDNAMLEALQIYESNKTFLDRAAKDGSIRYWFYFYAVLAALRLSRVTADILRARQTTARQV